MENLISNNDFDLQNIDLIAGLGNPGKEFLRTRHNVGFMFLDFLSKTFVEERRFKGLASTIELSKKKIHLIKPTTFMNTSGESVNLISKFYKIQSSNTLVVHDDLDIKFGEFKLQFSKGPKVHNGIISVERSLSTTNFWRLRIGVDNRSEDIRKFSSGSDYVLARFSAEEIKMLESTFKQILSFIELK